MEGVAEAVMGEEVDMEVVLEVADMEGVDMEADILVRNYF